MAGLVAAAKGVPPINPQRLLSSTGVSVEGAMEKPHTLWVLLGFDLLIGFSLGSGFSVERTFLALCI